MRQKIMIKKYLSAFILILFLFPIVNANIINEQINNNQLDQKKSIDNKLVTISINLFKQEKKPNG